MFVNLEHLQNLQQPLLGEWLKTQREEERGNNAFNNGNYVDSAGARTQLGQMFFLQLNLGVLINTW